MTEGEGGAISRAASPAASLSPRHCLGVSLIHLVESRNLFFLETKVVDNIFQLDVLKNMRQIKVMLTCLRP